MQVARGQGNQPNTNVLTSPLFQSAAIFCCILTKVRRAVIVYFWKNHILKARWLVNFFASQWEFSLYCSKYVCFLVYARWKLVHVVCYSFVEIDQSCVGTSFSYKVRFLLVWSLFQRNATYIIVRYRLPPLWLQAQPIFLPYHPGAPSCRKK